MEQDGLVKRIRFEATMPIMADFRHFMALVEIPRPSRPGFFLRSMGCLL
jgi:hypothetical protein